MPGSGFVPLISGTIGSGIGLKPVGSIQLLADSANSGSIYVSLSGGNQYSGQYGTLVGSGGPTINSGGSILSGGGVMDGIRLTPGTAYNIPHVAISNTGTSSGKYTVSVGADPGCSGPYGRVYYEVF